MGFEMSERGKDDAVEAMQDANKLLVTGIGRSGTKYMAELLTAVGIPCGHEKLFPTSCAKLPTWGDAKAESAWPAVPWLEAMRRGPDRVAVVHVVRDPLAWIASWSQTVWANPRRTRSTKYICHHTGLNWFEIIETKGALAASAQLWSHWNRMVQTHADVRLQVEHIGVPELAMICGLTGNTVPSSDILQEALDSVPRNVNARPHGPVAWDELTDDLYIYFKSLGREYGYETAPYLAGGAGI